MPFKKSYIEVFIHLLFWIFFFTSVNVDWTSNWLDPSIRPDTPSALLVLIFPIYFYANAFWLIPRFFNKKNWYKYLIYGFLIFAGPELIRILLHLSLHKGSSFEATLFNRDSFLFGAPSPFFFALNISFIYRFTKDWFANKAKIEALSAQSRKSSKPYEHVDLLSKAAIEVLSQRLQTCMEQEAAYLDADLTLRKLAAHIETSEKKLSYLLNQELEQNFYDYLNQLRVEHFQRELTKAENQNLSLLGIALNCGFKSKSSFYRAFKNHVGSSPAQYAKSLKS